MIISVLTSTLLFAYAMSREVEPVDCSEYELIAAAGNYSGIDGELFLGCGSVSEKPVYFYYFKAKDGCYQIEKVECSRFKIRESDIEAPKIILYNKCRIAQDFGDFGWFMKNWLGPILYYNYSYKHQTGEIVVPIGTIEKLNFRKLNL